VLLPLAKIPLLPALRERFLAEKISLDKKSPGRLYAVRRTVFLKKGFVAKFATVSDWRPAKEGHQ
jgi:hypothetical protein